jgi:hypothetical protein
MEKIGRLIRAMMEYDAGDARRIHHFLKVYALAKALGELEELDEDTQEILEIAALTHDIGIHNSERKYGSAGGRHQEIEGPPEAKALLSGLGIAPSVIGRVCWLIAHHHSYEDIREIDHQLLVEADFLVNLYEDGMPPETVRRFEERVFRSEAGKALLRAELGAETAGGFRWYLP